MDKTVARLTKTYTLRQMKLHWGPNSVFTGHWGNAVTTGPLRQWCFVSKAGPLLITFDSLLIETEVQWILDYYGIASAFVKKIKQSVTSLISFKSASEFTRITLNVTHVTALTLYDMMPTLRNEVAR